MPLDKSTIQSITPWQIYQWKGPGPDVSLTPETDTRIAAEQKWYNLTGRLVGIKVENDGDITLVLKDAEGKKAGNVGAEIPLGPTFVIASADCFRLDDAELAFSSFKTPKSSKCASRI